MVSKLPFDSHAMTAPEALTAIAGASRLGPETWKRLHDHELKHPKKPRKQVLDALEERAGEQIVGEPAQGTARGPNSEYGQLDSVTGLRVLLTDGSGMTHDAVLIQVVPAAIAQLRDPAGSRVLAMYSDRAIANLTTFRYADE